MKLCVCPAPLHDTAGTDRLRCARCAGWSPHGGLPSPERVAILAREATSLSAQLSIDYQWAHSVAFAPTRRNNGAGGKRTDHGDPTGDVVSDARRLKDGRPVGRLAVWQYTAIAARRLETALRALRDADEAIGEALLAAEAPGPRDHVRAPYHDAIPANRPDLADAHDARDRRHARGEGVPT